jgi:hypothetical protein
MLLALRAFGLLAKRFIDFFMQAETARLHFAAQLGSIQLNSDYTLVAPFNVRVI